MKRRLFLNSVSGVALFALNVVIAFILSPILVRVLGDRDFGVWEILLSLFGYLSILDLGVGPAIVRYVARASAAGDREEMDGIASSALVLLFASGVVGFVVMLGLGFFPHLIAPRAAEEIPGLFGVAVVLGANLVITFPGVVFSAWQFGLQRHTLANAVRFVQLIVQAVAWYWVLTRTDGPYLVLLSVVLAGGNALYFGILALAGLAGPDRIRLRRRLVTRARILELYRYGLKSVVLNAADRLQRQTVAVVIGATAGAAQVVYYAIPNRLATYATNLAGALTLPITPYFSFMEGAGRSASDTARAYLAMSRVLQFLLVGIGVAIAGLGEPFIARWIGPGYAETGRWVIRLLGLALVAEAIAPVATQLLLGKGRHGAQARRSLAIGAAGVAVYVAMGLLFGLTGVAAAFVLVRAATVGAWMQLASAALDIRPLRHLTHTLLRFALPAALGLAAFYALRRQAWPGDYPAMLLHGAIGGTIYAGSALALAVSAEERRLLGRLLRDRFARPARG